MRTGSFTSFILRRGRAAHRGGVSRNHARRRRRSQALAQKALASEEALKKLEALVHPLVRRAEWRLLLAEQDKGADLVVVEVPLLFETGAQTLFDAIIVVSAPAEAQRERMAARPGMTPEKFEAIVARQWPDAVKRERADFVVDTGVPLEDTYRQIDAVLEEIATKAAAGLSALGRSPRRLTPQAKDFAAKRSRRAKVSCTGGVLPLGGASRDGVSAKLTPEALKNPACDRRCDLIDRRHKL